MTSEIEAALRHVRESPVVEDGEFRDPEEDWPLPDVVVEGFVEHLPGKHNQATHGKGGVAGFLAADLAAHGGGSYMAKGLAPITTGAVVARPGHSGVFDRGQFMADPAYRKQVVAAYLRDNRSEFTKGGQLGTWDTGSEGGSTIVFDVIDNVPRAKAIALGKQRGEDGVFDLDAGEYIPTGGRTYTGGG